MKAKAREHNDLQSTYQAACAENERLKVSTRELDNERNEYRGVIRRIQQHSTRLEAYAQQLTQEKDRLIIDLQVTHTPLLFRFRGANFAHCLLCTA